MEHDMKTQVLCMVTIRRREYMSEREYQPESSLKLVWVGDGETPAQVVERHYDRVSDPYGTTWRVESVDEAETIGDP